MLSRDAIALGPRAGGVQGNTAKRREAVGSSSVDDFCVRPHFAMMHYALSESKCLSHHSSRYQRDMSNPNERLRQIRESRYPTAVEAAEAIGVKVPTYIQHENGTRGSGSLPRPAAERYARFFRVSLDWLLSGKGDTPIVEEPATLLLPVTLPNAADLTAMFGGLLDAAGRSDLADELAPQLARQFPAALARSLVPRLSQARAAVQPDGEGIRQIAKDHL
jgi:transcriptional regulator with XRE-family HTH domain